MKSTEFSGRDGLIQPPPHELTPSEVRMVIAHDDGLTMEERVRMDRAFQQTVPHHELDDYVPNTDKVQ